MRRKDREVTDTVQILSIIKQAHSCRLAMIDTTGPTPRPYVVALNFGFTPGMVFQQPQSPVDYLGDWGTVWFHGSSKGQKIDVLKRNPLVCLQIDIDHVAETGPTACDWGMKFQSLVGYGTVHFVMDPTEKKRGLDALMTHFDQAMHLSTTLEPSPMSEFVYQEKYLNATTVLRLDLSELTAKVRS